MKLIFIITYIRTNSKQFMMFNNCNMRFILNLIAQRFKSIREHKNYICVYRIESGYYSYVCMVTIWFYRVFFFNYFINASVFTELKEINFKPFIQISRNFKLYSNWTLETCTKHEYTMSIFTISKPKDTVSDSDWHHRLNELKGACNAIRTNAFQVKYDSCRIRDETAVTTHCSTRRTEDAFANRYAPTSAVNVDPSNSAKLLLLIICFSVLVCGIRVVT